jgi:hypothetical protein
MNIGGDTIVTRMLQNCKVVLRVNSISSGRGSKEGFPIYYIGIAGQKGFAVRLNGTKGRIDGVWTILGAKDTTSLTKVQVSNILNLYKNNKWDLNYNDRDTAGNYCFLRSIRSGKAEQCDINDAQIYFLKNYTKKGYTESALYAPDFYEQECCQGNINRINFLVIKKILYDLWK